MDFILFIDRYDLDGILGLSSLLKDLQKNKEFLQLSCGSHRLFVWCSTFRDTNIVFGSMNKNKIHFEIFYGAGNNMTRNSQLEIEFTTPLLILLSHFQKNYSHGYYTNYKHGNREINELPCLQANTLDWSEETPILLDSKNSLWISDIRSGGIEKIVRKFSTNDCDKFDKMENFLNQSIEGS